MKYLIFIFSFLCAAYNANSVKILTIDEVDFTAHVGNYNRLPSAEEADQNLQSHPSFQSFLEGAGKIITDSQLETYVGLRLIHRHFKEVEGRTMMERFELQEGVPSLVTSPQPVSYAKESGAAPSGWIVSSSSAVEAFEFSTDEAVKEGLRKLQQHSDVFLSLSQLIIQHKIEALIAIGIIKRSGLPFSGEPYMEKSFAESQSSIVQVRLPDSSSNVIQTSWSFVPRTHGCEYYCLSWCQSDESTGYSHEYSHDTRHG